MKELKMEDEAWKPAHDNVRKFERDVLQKTFPNARFSSSGMMGSPDIAPSSFKAEISPDNLFKGTEYEYKGDGKFIHFTSILALKSILDTGWIRMSEFSNLVDKQELVYASSVFENDKFYTQEFDKLEHLKRNVFCLSACESSQETQSDSFMWEIYGDKGAGVFIEFEYTNKQPYSHNLGNVLYGKENLKPLIQLKVLYDQFRIETNNFTIQDIFNVILEIKAFHKSKKYQSEKEVRLLFKQNKNWYEGHDHTSIYEDFNAKQEVKYFSKLYLKGRNPIVTDENLQKYTEEEICRYYPQIEIKRICLGYNISIENKVDIMKFISKLKATNNYDFELWHINNELEQIRMI